MEAGAALLTRPRTGGETVATQSALGAVLRWSVARRTASQPLGVPWSPRAGIPALLVHGVVRSGGCRDAYLLLSVPRCEGVSEVGVSSYPKPGEIGARQTVWADLRVGSDGVPVDHSLVVGGVADRHAQVLVYDAGAVDLGTDPEGVR